jgi:hypothetical protein
VEVVATMLCTRGNIRVLNSDDFIEFRVGTTDYKLSGTESNYVEDVSALLNDLFTSQDMSNIFFAELDTVGRVVIRCSGFGSITKISYNFSLICGLYYAEEMDFPLMMSVDESINNFHYSLTPKAIGYPISTPVFYLMSNLGSQCFTEKRGGSILMVINNVLMTSGSLLVAQQAEISSKVMSSDITNLELRLVDANFHDVDLLNPMYVTIVLYSEEST